MQTIGENGQSDTEKWGERGCGIKIDKGGKGKGTNQSSSTQWNDSVAQAKRTKAVLSTQEAVTK
jgi:hypothetical protein